MARTTVWITGDQCSPRNSALAAVDKRDAQVLFVESMARSESLPYHKRKLVLVFAVMRGFARDLEAAGWTVDYRAEQDEYDAPLDDHVRRFAPERIVAMEQTAWGLDDRLRGWTEARGLAFETTPQCNFVSTEAEFATLFSRGQARVTMENFYRLMRRKTGLLMEGSEPTGKAWNFDRDNREPPARDMHVPDEPAVPLHDFTRDAIELVERRFASHPGTIGTFDIPQTRADALAYADDFFATRLDRFGPYEDAMLAGEARMFHSRLSAMINTGLLHPLELCERAELAYRSGDARLASVEGFVRQLIGWREFIWQTYRRLMPEYAERNALGADLAVPEFYWDGGTEMRCVSEAMRDVLALGWAHHILRLMVLGNFALIAGISPQKMTAWFTCMFVDGWDWVMQANVVGMSLHADGGFVGTKPYAASANYIDKMSDFCGKCRYDKKKTVGDDACPYNALYWDFMDRNDERFSRNPRMGLVMRNWAGRDPKVKIAVRERAAQLRAKLANGERF